MICGYQWESELDQTGEDPQCDGHHECILQDHHHAEHECACGDQAGDC